MRNRRLHCHSANRALVAAGMLLLLRTFPFGQPAMAQGRILDQGVLRVVAGGTEIAREEFTVTLGSAVAGGARLRITTTAFYPPRRTKITISPYVELGPDSMPRMVQYAATNGDDERILAQIGPRRLTIRRISSRGESAREYPGAPRTLIVDDSVFALYAVPPGTASGTVRLVSPRRDVREDYYLTNRGVEQTVVEGEWMELLHLVLTAGADVRHLWYDDSGRLMKVEIPSRQLYAERMTQSN